MCSGSGSVLRHVIFQDLSNPSCGGWSLTGAVTFYESPVDIKYCRFLDSKAEDALNIIRSDFEINRSFFSGALFDAFDADFCEGMVTDSFFTGCGNDAVDVSGSVVELRNVSVDGAGDKGLSVGEKSKMMVRNMEIRNAGIAVASKDLSEICGSNFVISNCNTGFALYQKKTEFGPATINISGVAMNEVNMPYMIKDGSELKIDGKLVNMKGESQ